MPFIKEPPQKQSSQPGLESKMFPKPECDNPHYKGSEKLLGKVALITGGDSGIGKAVAIVYAKEGASLVLNYLPSEEKDAQETKKLVEQYGAKCLLIPGDISDENFCKVLIEQTVEKLGHLDILVNNAAVQYSQKSIEDISTEQLKKTFETNIFSMFYLCRAAVHHLKDGAAIINTTSVTAYKGHEILIDYASTKGAIVAFTRSLAQSLVKKNIRVNAVAPGPIWTPLIPATLPVTTVMTFGSETPMDRPGQPCEVAPCYVFLASEDSSYMSGQVLHPNGGVVVNS